MRGAVERSASIGVWTSGPSFPEKYAAAMLPMCLRGFLDFLRMRCPPGVSMSSKIPPSASEVLPTWMMRLGNWSNGEGSIDESIGWLIDGER